MNKKLLKNKRWMSHPWSDGDKVSLVSIDFLLKICNKESTNKADLLTGEIVSEDIVWSDIVKNGMKEPLLIRINPETFEVRLESGNHRIKTAKKDGYTHLPCAVFITKNTIFNKGNGVHKYKIVDLLDFSKLVNCPYDYQIKIDNYLTSNYGWIVLR